MGNSFQIVFLLNGYLGLFICHLYIFVCEAPVQIFGHYLLDYLFSNWILKILYSGYMCFIIHMIYKYFLTIWIVFIPLTVSFKKQMFLLLLNSSLTIFFMDCAFGIISKNFLPNPRSQRFSIFF